MSRFFILFLFIPIVSAQALTVVSDIDDTIKISHVRNRADAAIRFLFPEAFTGALETYQGLAEQGMDFIYLSGGPQSLAKPISGFLTSRDFPKGGLILKTNADPKSVGLYKLNRLKELFLKNNEDYLLIGDDTEMDFWAYSEIAKLYPARIKGIFIHEITGDELPSLDGTFIQNRFSNFYDFALSLYLNGFLTKNALSRVAEKILEEKKLNLILPDFQVCPTEKDIPSAQDQEVNQLSQLIALKMKKRCESRFDFAQRMTAL